MIGGDCLLAWDVNARLFVGPGQDPVSVAEQDSVTRVIPACPYEHMF